MIDAVMCVCGEREYFDMADYSIPSFLRANEGTKLVVFSDQPERLAHLATKKNLEIRDYKDSVERLVEPYREYYMKILDESNEAWYNNGVEHEHHWVAALPVLAERFTDSRMILKIDSDSIFKGDMCIKVITKLIEQLSARRELNDMYLVSRPNNGIIKPYGNEWPGVGFLMWDRYGHFIEEYAKNFDGNEQNTILVELMAKKNVSAHCFKEWWWHVTYPYWWAKKNGTEFSLDQLGQQYYIHFHGDDLEVEHNRLETMERVYKEIYG